MSENDPFNFDLDGSGSFFETPSKKNPSSKEKKTFLERMEEMKPSSQSKSSLVNLEESPATKPLPRKDFGRKRAKTSSLPEKQVEQQVIHRSKAQMKSSKINSANNETSENSTPPKKKKTVIRDNSAFPQKPDIPEQSRLKEICFRTKPGQFPKYSNITKESLRKPGQSPKSPNITKESQSNVRSSKRRCTLVDGKRLNYVQFLSEPEYDSDEQTAKHKIRKTPAAKSRQKSGNAKKSLTPKSRMRKVAPVIDFQSSPIKTRDRYQDKFQSPGELLEDDESRGNGNAEMKGLNAKILFSSPDKIGSGSCVQKDTIDPCGDFEKNTSGSCIQKDTIDPCGDFEKSTSRSKDSNALIGSPAQSGQLDSPRIITSNSRLVLADNYTEGTPKRFVRLETDGQHSKPFSLVQDKSDLNSKETSIRPSLPLPVLTLASSVDSLLQTEVASRDQDKEQGHSNKEFKAVFKDSSANTCGQQMEFSPAETGRIKRNTKGDISNAADIPSILETSDTKTVFNYEVDKRRKLKKKKCAKLSKIKGKLQLKPASSTESSQNSCEIIGEVLCNRNSSENMVVANDDTTRDNIDNEKLTEDQTNKDVELKPNEDNSSKNDDERPPCGEMSNKEKASNLNFKQDPSCDELAKSTKNESFECFSAENIDSTDKTGVNDISADMFSGEDDKDELDTTLDAVQEEGEANLNVKIVNILDKFRQKNATSADIDNEMLSSETEKPDYAPQPESLLKVLSPDMDSSDDLFSDIEEIPTCTHCSGESTSNEKEKVSDQVDEMGFDQVEEKISSQQEDGGSDQLENMGFDQVEEKISSQQEDGGSDQLENMGSSQPSQSFLKDGQILMEDDPRSCQERPRPGKRFEILTPELDTSMEGEEYSTPCNTDDEEPRETAFEEEIRETAYEEEPRENTQASSGFLCDLFSDAEDEEVEESGSEEETDEENYKIF